MVIFLNVCESPILVQPEPLQLNWMVEKSTPDKINTSLFIRIYCCYLWWIKTAVYYSQSIKNGGGESRRALISAHLGERILMKVTAIFFLGLCKHNLRGCSSHMLID